MIDEKKSTVMRVPNELVERINQYEKLLGKDGLSMNKTDLMRSFANQSVTRYDNAGEALKKIIEGKKKV